MSQLPHFAQDAAFGADEDPCDAPAGIDDARAARLPVPHARQPALIERLAEKSGIYAIVLVTIFGLANALGLF